jgi:uncharacterized protein YdhG (YjbR/CyaY superfamily)
VEKQVGRQNDGRQNDKIAEQIIDWQFCACVPGADGASIMAAKPKTFDDYLAALDGDQRAALEKLRQIIKAAAPQAEECISYGLAAFKLNGKPLVALGAAANHCAFYLMSGSTVEAHEDELNKYDTSKGTIRFPANKPLPASLVQKLVKARMAENSGRSGKAK